MCVQGPTALDSGSGSPTRDDRPAFDFCMARASGEKRWKDMDRRRDRDSIDSAIDLANELAELSVGRKRRTNTNTSTKQ